MPAAGRSRLAVILKRWVTIIAYSLIAAAIFIVGAPICIAKISTWIQEWHLSGDWYFWPALILFYLALAICVWRTPAKQRVLHVICFPPAWVAVIGGMCVIVLMLWLQPETLETLLPPFVSRGSLRQSAWELLVKAFIWVLMPVFVVALVKYYALRIVAFVKCYALRTRGVRSEDVNIPVPPLEYKNICQWICDDREIEDQSQDRFGHSAVAERMADRLAKWISGEASEKPDIMLVGEIGSGKTSILRLTERILQSNGVQKWESAVEGSEKDPQKKMGEQKGKSEQNAVFVQVSLWPFDTPEAAVRGVLDSLVREIGQYISPFALTGLSTSYLQAVE